VILRPSSLRTRLALWYGLAVGTALLLYAGGVYAFFRASLFGQLDGRLHEDYEVAEHAFEATADGGVRWSSPVHEPDAASVEAPWVEVSRPGGPTLLRRPVSRARSSSASRTREYTHRLGAEDYLIRVGRSEEGVRHELRELLLILGLGLLPGVLLAFLGGLGLARRALAPVGAMTERARSITAERLAERLPVENPRDELGQLATVFNEMIARLGRSFEQLRRFTADASHELRTPLTAIRSVGEVGLRERRDEAGYREVIGSMLEEADRLTQLVDGLLALSRSDADRVRLDRSRADLRSIARDVVAHLAVLADERNQGLTVDEGAPVIVEVDPVVLRQALTNLVDNAIKYGPPGSRVKVSVAERAGDATVAVTDEGPGIPPEHRGRLFERFFRVDPARPRGGVGLGLAIAKAAAEAHGGRIEFEAPSGGGSTFRIVIPLLTGGDRA
jgi:heavy metal sensor kinase